ncbi:MAG: hypothetical protein K5985_01450 [Lachnospiraceae bacterium]|nr:hypothetical protein [Lachnospiraceae bacterium]
MSETYDEMERLLRDVDFTKGSDHKGRLRDKLFGNAGAGAVSDELGPDELSLVSAAVKKDGGIDIPEKRK